MPVPVEMQSTPSECGLVCLAMVAGSYDPAQTLLSIRQRWPDPRHGLTLRDLASLAEELGLLCRALRCEPRDLKGLRKPCILHWDLEHFVVLVACSSRSCTIHDPALGRQRLGWSEVSSHFTGVVLELWPQPGGASSVPAVASLGLRDLALMARPESGSMICVLALSVLLQACVLAMPWHMQWTVDEAIVAGDTHLIGVLALAFGLLLVVRLAGTWVRELLVIYVGHALSFQMACRLLQHLLAIRLDWFEQRSVGDIHSRFAALQPVRELFTQGFAALVVDLLMIGLAGVLMIVYHPVIGLAVLTVHGLTGLVAWSAGGRLRRLSQSTVVAQAKDQAHLLESIRGIHTVKAYDQAGTRFARWQQLHGQTLGQSVLLQRSQLMLSLFIQTVGGIELLVVVYLIAHEVVLGMFTVGMLFAFVSYRGHFVAHTQGAIDRLLGLKALTVQVQRLSEIWCEPLQSRSGVSIGGGTHTLPLIACELGLRQGPRDAWIFRGVSLRIEAGDYVAIIGGSGSGKTTLLKLLMGLLNPSEGEVLLGDAPLHGSNCADFRRQMACVLQEDGLFSGSVLENLTLWQAPDADRVQEVLEAVGMWRSLMAMPMGLHTRVGEIGSGLSSGQVQRLMLARALYRQPRYLFLDEGTANLDQASAGVVQEVLDALQCTRVVVTHDLSLAGRARRCLLLEQGKLREVQVRNATALSADP